MNARTTSHHPVTGFPKNLLSKSLPSGITVILRDTYKSQSVSVRQVVLAVGGGFDTVLDCDSIEYNHRDPIEQSRASLWGMDLYKFAVRNVFAKPITQGA